MSNSPKPGASIRSHDRFRNCAPTRVVSGANNGLKNVGLENMAINSTLSFARIPSDFEIASVVKKRVDGFRILPSFVGAGERTGRKQKRIGKLR